MAPTDARFARLQTDPRFRKPKQKNLKVEIDERFRDVLESEEFGGGGAQAKVAGKGKGRAVDKRGRPLAPSHQQDQLKRFYRLRSASPSGDAEGDGTGFIDYARGEGVLPSSGSEDESGEEESEIEDEELEIGGKASRPRLNLGDNLSDESDDDEGNHLEIDLSEDDNVPVSAFPPEIEGEEGDEEVEEKDQPIIEPTTRIAAVNLDWDNLRAGDLFTVFNSFLKMGSSSGRGKKGASKAIEGKLLSVRIYPSEFGKMRMEREEREGPGGGVFLETKKKGEKKRRGKEEIVVRGQEEEDEEEEEADKDGDDDDELEDRDSLGEGESVDEADDIEHGSLAGSDEDASGGEDEYDDDDDVDFDDNDESEPDYGNLDTLDNLDNLEILSDVSSNAGSEDIDMDKLRQYQLERLRYFYAVATFSTVEAASHVMLECDGTEFERTANVMDLSYVPDGMEFDDDEIKDEATKEPKGYRGNDFVTDALRHSKVKLTWDQDDPNRAKLTRRTLTRDEIEEQDFKAFIASSESESSDDEGPINDPVPGDFSATATGTGRPTLSSSSGDRVNGDKGKGLDKKSKKAAMKERTAKLRALLLSGDNDEGDIWGKAGLTRDDPAQGKGKKGKGKKGGDADGDDDEEEGGGMEITFKPALSGELAGDEENMTTLERYQMRLKEKKARKKEKAELRRATKEGGDDEESESDSASKSKTKGKGKDKDKTKTKTKTKVKSKAAEDDFFGEDDDEEAEEPHQNDLGQQKGKAKNGTLPETNDDEDDENLHEDLVGGSAHFSMKDILKAEKSEGKKRRRKKASKLRKEAEAEAAGRTREVELGKEDWKIDVKDPRFKALHEEAEFAIDPSNPHFSKTSAMKELLAERTRVRKRKESKSTPNGESSRPLAQPSNANSSGSREKDLGQLVQSVKRKMDQNQNRKKRSRK